MRENFPLFLLPKHQEHLVETLNLTDEEYELLGLEILYCDEQTPKTHISKSLRNLPYEYVKKHGSFKVMHIHETLMEKLGGHKNFIVNYAIANPDKRFSLKDATDDEILTLTKYLRSDTSNNLNGNLMQYEVIANASCVFERMVHIENKKMPVFSTQPTNDGTGRSFWQPVGDGEKYVFRNNIGFNVVQNPREETFVVADVFKEYFEIEMVESETPEYVQQKEKYAQDLAFYNEHTNMLNKPPMPPAFMGVVYLVMNERGKQLYDWYFEVGKNMNLFAQRQPQEVLPFGQGYF